MASNGVQPGGKGAPAFPEGDALASGADLEELARLAVFRGNLLGPGTTAEMNSFGYPVEGMFWSNSQDGELYRRTSGSWRVVPMARIVFAHAGKTAGFQSMSGGVIATVALQDASGGVTLSDNGLIIPVTGRYQVNARFWYSGSGGGTVRGDLYVNGSSRVQGRTYKEPAEDTTVALSQVMLLTAGDKLQLWSNYGDFMWGSDGYNGTYMEVLRVA